MTKLVRFDWAMKYLLRNKANFDILEGFLSELLKTTIRIECVLESESNQNHADDKYNRVDVLVHTQKGQRIIIEVQCVNQWDYLSRILYGTSKVICEYVHQGDPYKNIGKVISVSIVFFNVGEGKDYLYRGHTIFQGMHLDDLMDLNPQEREFYAGTHPFVYQTPANIFPEYYLIRVSQFHELVQNKLDEWIYFLKNGEIKREFSAQGIQSASEKLNVLRLNEKERRAYEKYQEYLHDEASFNEMMQMIKKDAEKEFREAKQKAEEAKQRAEKAKQRAEKAKQRAEEAKQQAEQVKQRAEEAKQQAEEAKQQAEAAKQKAEEEAKQKTRHIAHSLKQAGLSDEDIMLHMGLSPKEMKELF